jgi:hypothetical protein
MTGITAGLSMPAWIVVLAVSVQFTDAAGSRRERNPHGALNPRS